MSQFRVHRRWSAASDWDAPAARDRRTSPAHPPCRSSRQGKPSKASQRMQMLVGVALPSFSSSRMPSGRWNGCSPCAAKSSLSAWMRGSCDTGGIRERPARGRLGRILAALAVHVEQPLGLGIIGLEHLISAAATRARCRPRGEPRRNPARAGATAPRHRPWSCRRRNNASPGWNARPSPPYQVSFA